MSDPNFVKDLCDGLPEDIQRKIKGAYWQGCNDGIEYAKAFDSKVDRTEGNVTYLKHKK